MTESLSSDIVSARVTCATTTTACSAEVCSSCLMPAPCYLLPSSHCGACVVVPRTRDRTVICHRWGRACVLSAVVSHTAWGLDVLPCAVACG